MKSRSACSDRRSATDQEELESRDFDQPEPQPRFAKLAYLLSSRPQLCATGPGVRTRCQAVTSQPWTQVGVACSTGGPKHPVRDRKEPSRRSDQDSSDPPEVQATIDMAKLLHGLAESAEAGVTTLLPTFWFVASHTVQGSTSKCL